MVTAKHGSLASKAYRQRGRDGFNLDKSTVAYGYYELPKADDDLSGQRFMPSYLAEGLAGLHLLYRGDHVCRWGVRES